MVGELGIFLSLKGSIEGAKSRAYLEIILSLRASIEGERLRNFSRPKASLERESLKFFQVPDLIMGGG